MSIRIGGRVIIMTKKEKIKGIQGSLEEIKRQLERNKIIIYETVTNNSLMKCLEERLIKELFELQDKK